MWDPLEQLVLAVDFDGRVTRSIGPLSGGMYYSDFIPYVNSYTEIYIWVQLQLQNHPAKFWEDGIKDYITHAFEIMVFYLCFILKSIVHCQVHEAKRSLLDYFFTELGATKESYVLIFLKKLEVQDNDLLYMFVVMPYFLGIWI
ncbi:uncharacterized protein LOC119322313 [Triticum dicoccoides]|uniref:uncharacterized protein LOC119322313 n=1 Tax=Triticum dicoccoides TaxID=85692 RepID=UPI0018915191|nr:uncharacterized protein LOC119322313 [Triticum dicoccoides]